MMAVGARLAAFCLPVWRVALSWIAWVTGIAWPRSLMADPRREPRHLRGNEAVRTLLDRCRFDARASAAQLGAWLRETHDFKVKHDPAYRLQLAVRDLRRRHREDLARLKAELDMTRAAYARIRCPVDAVARERERKAREVQGREASKKGSADSLNRARSELQALDERLARTEAECSEYAAMLTAEHKLREFKRAVGLTELENKLCAEKRQVRNARGQSCGAMHGAIAASGGLNAWSGRGGARL